MPSKKANTKASDVQKPDVKQKKVPVAKAAGKASPPMKKAAAKAKAATPAKSSSPSPAMKKAVTSMVSAAAAAKSSSHPLPKAAAAAKALALRNAPPLSPVKKKPKIEKIPMPEKGTPPPKKPLNRLPTPFKAPLEGDNKPKPPPEWQSTLRIIQFLRQEKTADVDRIGCNMLADQKSPDQAFHHLVAALLSSQTKDMHTAQAVTNLKALKPTGANNPGKNILDFKFYIDKLSAEKIYQCDEDQVDEAIKMVGFHKTKASNLKKIADILLAQGKENKSPWKPGEVPNTKEGLCALPGVGPKMSILVLQEAFGKGASGICVDIHVHRICNLLGWVRNNDMWSTSSSVLSKLSLTEATGGATGVAASSSSSSSVPASQQQQTNGTAEDTRVQLEAWLPQSEWRDINPLLVGLGQLLNTVEGREYLLKRALMLVSPRTDKGSAAQVAASNAGKELNSMSGPFAFYGTRPLDILEQIGCPLLFKGPVSGKNLLHYACEYGLPEVIQYVLYRYDVTKLRLTKLQKQEAEAKGNSSSAASKKKLQLQEQQLEEIDGWNEQVLKCLKMKDSNGKLPVDWVTSVRDKNLIETWLAAEED